MNPEHRLTSHDELLAQLSWVRRLARALVHDVTLADDLTQEAMRITLAQPAGRVLRGGALRAWLASVVRKVACDAARSERGRRAREQAAARREAEPGTFEVVERSAMQQRVVHAVMALAEPYRSTLLYRYLDDLSTAEVAARMRTQEPTVRKRLSRGLEQLRAKLDREFGRDTTSWALALVGPWASPVASTAGVVKGALLVTAKLKLAAAVVLVAASSWIVWRQLCDDASPTEPERAPRWLVAAPETIPTDAGAQEEDLTRAPLESTDTSPGGQVDQAGEDITLLRVRVEDPSRQPITAGRLSGWWDERAKVERNDTKHFFECAIDGALTTVRLPAAAREALLAASAAEQPPAAAVRVSDLRRTTAGEQPRGTVVHEVRVIVGRTSPGPTLNGAIFVDGERRTPSGLMIEVEQPTELARVNTVTATYQAGPFRETHVRMWVTSDETVPVQLPLPEAPTDSFDLRLTTERTLELLVIDAVSRQPLPRQELHQTTDVEVARDFPRVTYRGRSSMVVTDLQGRCTIRGLPKVGHLYLRTETTPVKKALRMRDGATMVAQLLPEPVWALRLTADLPAKLTHTLALMPPSPPATVFGYLPASLDDARVVTRSLSSDPNVPHDPFVLALDAERRWQLEAKVPSEHELWIERGSTRLSEAVRVPVTASGPLGPIDLPLLSGREVSVRVINVPASGHLRLAIDPDQAFRHELDGTEVRHRFKVEADGFLVVSYASAADEETSSWTQRIPVGPNQPGEIVVDLHADQMRDLELHVSTGPLVGHGVLGLMSCANGTVDERQRVVAELRDGKATHPIVVPPGAFFYIYQSSELDGLVAGFVTVAAAGGDRTLSIDMAARTHPAASLGKGIQLDALGGTSLASWPQRLRKIRWRGGEETITLPAGCEFTTLWE